MHAFLTRNLMSYVGRDSDIVQLAATCEGKMPFNVYILPNKVISPGASNIHHLTVTGGQLFHRGCLVTSKTTQEALEEFLEWLDCNSVLVAHNGKSFDSIILYHHICHCSLSDSFSSKVLGFSDTLPIFRKAYPQFSSHSIEYLVNNLLHRSPDDAHNAVDDVKNLQELVIKSQITWPNIQEFSFPITYTAQKCQISANRVTHMPSLSLLVSKKVISKGMSRKIAGSGLGLSHLITTYKCHGPDGVISLLSEKKEKKPRVTSNKKILNSINEWLCTETNKK